MIDPKEEKSSIIAKMSNSILRKVNNKTIMAREASTMASMRRVNKPTEDDLK